MIILFYIFSIIAVAAILCMIVSNHPVHALLYLICSLLFVSCDLFFLHAPFAAAIEIIVYAGAIMVLFLFFIMMLDMKNISIDSYYKECMLFLFKKCYGILLLIIGLLGILLTFIFEIKNCFINTVELTISIKQIGITLFGPYMLIVEMASMLLLSALVSVFHISCQEDCDYDKFTDFQLNNKK